MNATLSRQPTEPTLAGDLGAVRQRLHGLVQRALGEAALSHVSHAMPAAETTGSCRVNLYFAEVGPVTLQPQAQPARIQQFNARFLVTTWASDAVAAADDLTELLLTALAEPEVEVDLQPLPPAAWSAFGLAPRPSFMLAVPVRRVRAQQPAPPVREAVLRLSQT